MDLSSLLVAVVNLQHNAKVIALGILAFYIVGDAVATMIKERKYLDWRYAVNYIRKFSDVFLGLAVMAVMGQYVPAVDALFWISAGIYTKSELEGLTKKFGAVSSEPVVIPPSSTV